MYGMAAAALTALHHVYELWWQARDVPTAEIPRTA
jgi:hypothetical protein